MARQRAGAYRQSFFNSEQMQAYWLKRHDFLLSLQTPHQHEDWSPAELVAAFAIDVWQWARPRSWSNGKRPQREGEACLLESSPLSLIQNTRLRGLPPEFADVLLDWHEGKVDLQLFFHIPSADEVLASQTRGSRCVSLLIGSESDFVQGGEDRDSFSFVLHDLIHASHFFATPRHFERQVYFSKLMFALRAEPALDLLQKDVEGFAEELDYLASDMNTHWIHSFKCLKSLFTRPETGAFPLQNQVAAFLKKDGLSPEEFTPVWSQLNSAHETEETRQKLDEILQKALEGART